MNKKTVFRGAFLLGALWLMGVVTLPQPQPTAKAYAAARRQPAPPAPLQRAWNTVRLMLR
ncbi:hypothetical protein [Hymenobacter weizhouensis]|uniref:hypothetical protein n=1 Tax=Hymenobacter sp. YIM 151500-1 TaxID=2987689 RepID=UPI00222654DF|nr:hypothetical protein [Hymenobacter sp. YIM 151500-1]UYZ63036.1 hypothetical protein OIS53_18835 [Hymenobacter sp. YIM 151500-1]